MFIFDKRALSKNLSKTNSSESSYNKASLSKKLIATALFLSLATSQANAFSFSSLFSIFNTKKTTKKSGSSLTSPKTIISLLFDVSAIALIAYFWLKKKGPQLVESVNPPKSEVKTTEQTGTKEETPKKKKIQNKEDAETENNNNNNNNNNKEGKKEPKIFTASPLYKNLKGQYLTVMPHDENSNELKLRSNFIFYYDPKGPNMDFNTPPKDPNRGLKQLIEQGAYIYIEWPHTEMAGRNIENCFTSSIHSHHLEKSLYLAANGIKLTGDNNIRLTPNLKYKDLHQDEKPLFIYQEYDTTKNKTQLALNNPLNFDENLLQDVVFSRSILEVTQEDIAPQDTTFYALYFEKKLSLQDLKNIKARSLVCRPDMKEGIEKLEMALLSKKFETDGNIYETDALSEDGTQEQAELFNYARESDSKRVGRALSNSFRVLHDLSFNEEFAENTKKLQAGLKDNKRILPPEIAGKIIHFAGIENFEDKQLQI